MNIIKRDGREIEFDITKIINAILKANKDVVLNERITNEDAEKIANRIKKFYEVNQITPTVEEIQDEVENNLMEDGYFYLAREYIKFRHNKELARNKYNEFMEVVTDKLMASNIENQNANVDERSFGGRVGEASRVLTKKYALDFIVSEMARKNHLNNEIYIHDLDSYAVGQHNCLSIPFDKLLAEGFNTRQTDIRPASSINTAFQLVAVIFQLQSLQQFGGVSATHLDWTMVPYVRKSFYKHWKDGMNYIEEIYDDNIVNIPNVTDLEIRDFTYQKYSKAFKFAMDATQKELKQAVEGLYHNLNTLQSRSGNQLPFTSINYGTCTLPEGRMVIEALLRGSIAGVGKFHRTPIFPCGIFQYMKGVNDKPGTPNYDLKKLAIKSTAQRLYPNYANVDWSGNAGYDRNDPKTYFSTMGCRTANGYDINAEPGTNPQTKDGRGNICPVTIILPTLAMEADRDVDKFMSLLDTKIHEARDMLIERFDWIASQSPDSARFMYENGTMLGYKPEEGIRSALKHGTLAVGMLGLAETLQLLIGKNQLAPEGMELAKRICKLYKDRCAEFKEQYRLNFGVYFTPAENLCHTALEKFRDKYGVIKDVSDKEFFTNSIHVPVWEEIDPFTKIDTEAELTGYSSAGCITYVELDASANNNLVALEQIVDYAMSKDIPYFALNLPNDMCNECGYTGDINKECPMCGSDDISRLRRVTGYLTGDYRTAFNKGKQQEAEMRFKHTTKGWLKPKC